jgi:hypothetical protein
MNTAKFILRRSAPITTGARSRTFGSVGAAPFKVHVPVSNLSHLSPRLCCAVKVAENSKTSLLSALHGTLALNYIEIRKYTKHDRSKERG